MKNPSPTNTTASSLPARKITRRQLAALYSLSVRCIAELTRSGVLGHYRIGKCVRYDLAEAEASLRAHFHVQATPHPVPGRAGCPQPAAPEPTTTELLTPREENLSHAIDQSGTESQRPLGGGLRTSLPTSSGLPTSTTNPQA